MKPLRNEVGITVVFPAGDGWERLCQRWKKRCRITDHNGMTWSGRVEEFERHQVGLRWSVILSDAHVAN
jgi:hypothetical protein